MLATNLFVLTVLVVLALGGALYWLIGRRIVKISVDVCDRIDEDFEAKTVRERLDREAEAIARAKAEAEVDAHLGAFREAEPAKPQSIHEIP